MHKFAEICLLCQKREFFTIFHHSNENGPSSANFEARPLILFANENLEQVLFFCSSHLGSLKFDFSEKNSSHFTESKNTTNFEAKKEKNFNNILYFLSLRLNGFSSAKFRPLNLFANEIESKF